MPDSKPLGMLQHTDLLKSLEDPNTYLVSSSGDPLQQSLSGLLLDGLPPSASAAFLPKTGNNLEVCHLWLRTAHSHVACPGDLPPWQRMSRSYACTAGHWLLLKACRPVSSQCRCTTLSSAVVKPPSVSHV